MLVNRKVEMMEDYLAEYLAWKMVVHLGFCLVAYLVGSMANSWDGSTGCHLVVHSEYSMGEKSAGRWDIKWADSMVPL
jgi:hypothetical protein